MSVSCSSYQFSCWMGCQWYYVSSLLCLLGDIPQWRPHIIIQRKIIRYFNYNLNLKVIRKIVNKELCLRELLEQRKSVLKPLMQKTITLESGQYMDIGMTRAAPFFYTDLLVPSFE